MTSFKSISALLCAAFLFAGANLYAGSYNPVILGQSKAVRDCSRELCRGYQRDISRHGGDKKLLAIIHDFMKDADDLSDDLHDGRPLKDLKGCVARMDDQIVEIQKRASNCGAISSSTWKTLKHTSEFYLDFREHYQRMTYTGDDKD